ncbi:MAG: DUF935 family protein [Ignavibacteriales bacterium]|nr:MAG: DUF935 family protein [Ignavibacteriales bacterium]
MPYHNSDLTNSLLPTTTQIKRYLRLANISLTEKKTKRDVRLLMSYLQRLQEVDGRFLGLVERRKRAVRARKFDIQLPAEYKMTSVEEKQLLETKTRFRKANIFSLWNDIIDGIIFGQSAVRLYFDNTRFGTMVTKKESYDLTELDHSETLDNWLDELITDEKTKEFSRIPLDPDINIITRFSPMKNRKHYVGSYARAINLLSFLKYHTRWHWADNNERHGIPPTYATHPEALDEVEISKLIAMVEKLKKDSVAVFPEYVKILYEQALKSDSTDSFKEFLDAANTEMAITIVGQNLTTEVQGGSRAAAQVQNEVDDLITDADVDTGVDIITNQYLKLDFINNYGEPRNDYFEFVEVKEEQEDYESNSRIFTNIFTDEELREKIPIGKSVFYKKLGIPEPKEGEEVIQFAPKKKVIDGE